MINRGNKIICHQLRPAEFIRLYEEKRDCPDNVIAKPDFDVLRLLAVAYDLLGDTENALAALDQMVAIAPEKKKPLAALLKASMLYTQGNTEEAELLYREALNSKMDIMAKSTADLVLKTDRALALGDYTTAEAFFKQMLTRSFPKQPPLSVLTAHYALGNIYSMTGRKAEAREHLNDCIENGGETYMKMKAAAMMNDL